MRLTNNEKKVLKLLLENSRMSDSEIALKLNISNVAVGKIRKKLESTIIEAYSLKLNFSRMGIKTFALAITKLTNEGLNLDLLELEKKILDLPQVIGVSRTPKGSSRYLILYAFKNLDEIDNFFHFSLSKYGLDKFFENQDLFIFSDKSLIKYSCLDLFHKLIDDSKLKISKMKFSIDNDLQKKLT